jgi:hypothetical protein
MFGCAAARASSVSWIALPVASSACAMRRTPWPPSRVRCRPSGPARSSVNGTPCCTSHSTAAALCCETKRAAAFVDQAGAGLLRVVHVGVDAVVGAEHADDAALRPRGRAFLQAALGQHDHAPPVGQVQRRAQPGQAGTDDDDRERGVTHWRTSCCALRHSFSGRPGELMAWP